MERDSRHRVHGYIGTESGRHVHGYDGTQFRRSDYETSVGFPDVSAHPCAEGAVHNHIVGAEVGFGVVDYGTAQLIVVVPGSVCVDLRRFLQESHGGQLRIHEGRGGESVSAVVPGSADEQHATAGISLLDEFCDRLPGVTHQLCDGHPQCFGVGVHHPGVQRTHQKDHFLWLLTRISPILGRSSVLDITPLSTLTQPCLARGALG